MTPFLTDLNEPQRESIERLRETLKWCHYTDLIVRKDGEDHHFETDWLSNALTRLCGSEAEGLYPAILDLRRDIKSLIKTHLCSRQDIASVDLTAHLNKSLELLWTLLTDETEQLASPDKESTRT